MRAPDSLPTKSPPAYFLSLTVENIRCFGPKQTLDLSDGNGRPAPWTIILGDNGFGKTTLLQCLAGMQPVRQQWSRVDGEQTPLIMFSSGFFANSLEQEGLVRNFPCQIECSIFFGSEILSKEDGNLFNLSFQLDTKDSTAMSVAVLDGQDISQLICYPYGAKRQMGSTSLTIKNDRNRTHRALFDDTSLINAEEWYLQADYAFRRASSIAEKNIKQKQIELIKGSLIKLLPSVEDIEIVESELGARLEVKTSFGKVHIQDLSLGYRTLIAWIVDLAHKLFERYPKSKNPLEEPAVVLVDEIDLHLHPRFQRTLMSYLTGLFPNTQFIATAHSPLVVQASSNANIVLLRREDDHVLIDNNVENIENWRVDQILTSDLFGLRSARQLEVESFELEREAILSKPKLTVKDKNRLEFLESKISDLPIGETPGDRKAMDIIRRLAKEVERVKKESK